MGFLELLTIVFVVLKLTGVIAWSWWVVFIPLIAALTVYAIFAIFAVILQVGVYRSIKKDLDDDFFK